MLETRRQERLNVALKALRGVPGLQNIQSDDWDSAYVNVFLTAKRNRSNQIRFLVPLRTIMDGIRKAMKGTGIDYNFLDWPQKMYSWAPRMPGLPRERYDDGYNQEVIKLEVQV